MKLKILLIAVLALIGLWFVNKSLNETPRYREDSPSTGQTPGGEVREVFTVGFLPVT
jgi:hypothetical protein